MDNKNLNDLKLTDLELKILKAARTNEYGDAGDLNYPESPWRFAVLDEARIDSKQGRGILSSLIKKELIVITDNEEKGKFDDMSLSFTDKAFNLVKKGLI